MRNLFPFILLLCLSGCVREVQDIPPAIASNPVFFADMQLDQQSQRLTAGENGYTMHTAHFTDEQGVTHYLSTFSSDNCQQNSCPSLELEFFDNQVVSHPESGVDFTFQKGIKNYYSAAEDSNLEFKVGLVADGYVADVAYWTTGMDTTPITSDDISMTATANGYVDFCFYRSGNTGCDKTASYCFHNLASTPFVGILKADRTFGEYILIEVDSYGGIGPYTYTWMNGATTPFILVPAADGEIDVTVTATDAAQSQIDISQTIEISNGNAEMCGGSPHFMCTVDKAPFTQFSSVIVRYIDVHGKMFSTAYGAQTGKRFDILSVNDFGASPEGYATKQLSLSASGTLYTPDGSGHMTFTADPIVIAVSYEE